ncbi:MAG: helicase C-terminal domain-containing protein [Candidatus Omnitrophota bacterium]|nr:helicase C-terminal domain-containing protein [Candidatus Omnitrophota bacterium]
MKSYIHTIFDKDGPVANAMHGYEVRHEQIEMAEAVASAISHSEQLIVEAGTGIGKSFAYLVPLAEYAIQNGSLGIVSTNTISLQEQIINKDIPFLEKALDKDFKAVLVKGRNNYLCLRRLHRSEFLQKDLFSDQYELTEFTKIFAWSYKTQDGTLYDLAEEPDPKVWGMVSNDSETCVGKNCQYYKKCFFQKAREKIAEARILVINHHLFFSNLALLKEEKNIFPDWDALIFDEAHSIEGVATEHLGAGITNTGVRYVLDLLFNIKKQKGFLLTVGDQDSMELVELARRYSDSFFKEVAEYFSSNNRKEDSDTLRIKEKNFVENSLSGPLTRLSESLLSAKKNCKDKESEVELASFIRKINALKDSAELIVNQDMGNYVYWTESSRNKKISRVSINMAPVNIGEILHEELFNQEKPIILTSATLSINKGSFEYFKNRIGAKKAIEMTLGSPFDYKNQVRMYIAKNMPSPDNFTDYAIKAADRIKRYLDITDGSAFVLFTSYSLMNSVYEEMEAYLNEKGYNVLRQGNGLSRNKMLASFKKETGSVLFGVDTFWQGIDVQGSALSNVIITKLPFAVPDHPVIEARIEDIQKRGGDAFLEYNLPEAVLKFKQGFGRLIRSKKDTGIIAILDSRIINKFYGRAFLNSIPECEIIID